MKRKRTRRGFTFAEILLSVFLIACAGVIVGGTLPAATSSKTKADYMNTAVNFAQKHLEQLKALGYSGLTAKRLDSEGLIDAQETIAENTYNLSNVNGGSAPSAGGVNAGADDDDDDDNDDNDDNEGNSNRPNNAFGRVVKISDLLPSGGATLKLESISSELKRATITITWRERGQNRTYSVGTLVADL